MADMKGDEARRKIIRQWMVLPKDKRQTLEQAAVFAQRATEQNQFQRSRRDPYERVMGWLLPRTGKS
jgi:hypothetical protein